MVNKNTLRYEGSALEKILEQKFDDPGRQAWDLVSCEKNDSRLVTHHLSGTSWLTGASRYGQGLLSREELFHRSLALGKLPHIYLNLSFSEPA